MRPNSISADPMAVIRVPKTPKKAFDPQRPAGTLLQSQLKHLEWAVRPAGERRGKAFRIRPAKTEAEAAARIAKLNATLHRQATAPRDVMPPNPDLARGAACNIGRRNENQAASQNGAQSENTIAFAAPVKAPPLSIANIPCPHLSRSSWCSSPYSRLRSARRKASFSRTSGAKVRTFAAAAAADSTSRR